MHTKAQFYIIVYIRMQFRTQPQSSVQCVVSGILFWCSKRLKMTKTRGVSRTMSLIFFSSTDTIPFSSIELMWQRKSHRWISHNRGNKTYLHGWMPLEKCVFFLVWCDPFTHIAIAVEGFHAAFVTFTKWKIIFGNLVWELRSKISKESCTQSTPHSISVYLLDCQGK